MVLSGRARVNSLAGEQHEANEFRNITEALVYYEEIIEHLVARPGAREQLWEEALLASLMLSLFFSKWERPSAFHSKLKTV